MLDTLISLFRFPNFGKEPVGSPPKRFWRFHLEKVRSMQTGWLSSLAYGWDDLPYDADRPFQVLLPVFFLAAQTAAFPCFRCNGCWP